MQRNLRIFLLCGCPHWGAKNKNGRGCYAVISIKDYEKLTATRTLFSEFKKGEDSAKEKGWLSTKNVREMVGL